MASAPSSTDTVFDLLKFAAPWLAVAAFLIFGIWETIRPLVAPRLKTARRWSLHFLLYLLGIGVIRLFPSLSAIALSLALRTRSWGLLNHDALPFAVQIVLGICAIDLADYWKHRAFHSYPILWRVHILHHSDRDYDFTVGARFHPIEIFLDAAVRWAVVAIFVPPPLAVLIADVMVGVSTMFVHSNIRLPETAERIVQWATISPQFHRIHHSVEEAAQGHNLGVLFPWWDRCFGTFWRAGGDQDGEVGVKEISPEQSVELGHILAAPFASARSGRVRAVSG